MGEKKKANGKECLLNLLNVYLSNIEKTEVVIDSQTLDFLLDKLNVMVKEEKMGRGSRFTLEQLDMFNARFGLDDGGDLKSYEEVANKFNTTDVRVRQAEVQGIRNLTSYQMIEENNISRGGR